jgi:hypothetical protein
MMDPERLHVILCFYLFLHSMISNLFVFSLVLFANPAFLVLRACSPLAGVLRAGKIQSDTWQVYLSKARRNLEEAEAGWEKGIQREGEASRYQWTTVLSLKYAVRANREAIYI